MVLNTLEYLIMIVSRHRNMKMLLKSCCYAISCVFDRFCEDSPEICQRYKTKTDPIFEILVLYICTCIAPECQNRSENLINRKLSIFYIETMNQLFFQLQQKIYFLGSKIFFEKKNRPKIFFGENPEKNLKFSIFRFFC